MAYGRDGAALLFVLFIVLPLAIYCNLAVIQSERVWSSMQGWQYLLYVLLSLGTLVSFSFSIPEGCFRDLVPWLGRTYIPITLIYLFWSVEISLFILSIRFYANTIIGEISFVTLVSWFLSGFTPMLSISCLGGGFGAVMILFTFPAWLGGCSLLGLTYCLLATSSAPQLAVVLSCLLKVGLLLVAPAKGFLGGRELSQRGGSPSHASPATDE